MLTRYNVVKYNIKIIVKVKYNIKIILKDHVESNKGESPKNGNVHINAYKLIKSSNHYFLLPQNNSINKYTLIPIYNKCNGSNLYSLSKSSTRCIPVDQT